MRQLIPRVETDSPEGRTIRRGKPELLLYHSDLTKAMSYPDFIEEGGRFFVTETEKHVARVHEIPAAFLRKMWTVLEDGTIEPESEELLTLRGGEQADTRDISFALTGGKGLSFEFSLSSPEPGIILDSTGVDGRGLRIEWTQRSRIVFRMNDARQEFIAESETLPDLRHAVVIVDGGPGIVSFVADGRFLDGGGFIRSSSIV